MLLHVGNADYIDSPPEQVLGEQAIAILQGIAQQTALSLQNISLVSAAEEETMISSFLLQVSKILVGSSTLTDGINQTIEMLYDITGFDNLAFLRFDPDTYSYEISHRILDQNQSVSLRRERFDQRKTTTLNAIIQCVHSQDFAF